MLIALLMLAAPFVAHLQIRILARLVYLMLWLFLGLPPAVRALVTPPFTVSSSFRFPTVQYCDAVRYIHTPEYLETFPDYFRIRRVAQPIRYGNFVTVTIDCHIQSLPHTLILMANPEANSTCTYMCFQAGIRRGEVSLSARRLSKGHALTMDTTYFSRARRVVDTYLQPTVGFLARFGNSSVIQPTPHANLQWYRRMVLGLPNTPDRWL